MFKNKASELSVKLNIRFKYIVITTFFFLEIKLLYKFTATDMIILFQIFCYGFFFVFLSQ